MKQINIKQFVKRLKPQNDFLVSALIMTADDATANMAVAIVRIRSYFINWE